MSEAVKILIIGNGFGGVYALKNLCAAFHGDKNTKFAMVGERNYFLFTPLLHEVATGSLNPSNIIEPIREVLGCFLDKFYLGKVSSVSLQNRTVSVGDKIIPYDYLVLAPGATANFYNIPGAEQYSFPLKSIEDAVKIKNHCITQMERATHETSQEERRKMLRFVVVGGGPTGVELAAELRELINESFSKYYPCEILKDVSVVLVHRDTELVQQFGPKIKKKTLEVLNKKDIEVMLGSAVKEVGPDYIIINENEKILSDMVIWTAGIKPAEIIFDEPIAKSGNGRILVNEFLQLPSHKEVFALGDIAAFKDKKTNEFLPALAQVAEKESKVVAKNIKFLINKKPIEEFSYRSSGILMSLGQWMAVGEIFNFTFSGHFAWWLWRTVYLIKFLSWRKKIRVAIDWTMNLFSPRDIAEL
ncbi:MAG: NAD(P)/FAD-dependent oxidoreductase [Minisyncoccia bacterium]